MAGTPVDDGAFARLADHSDQPMVVVTTRAGDDADGCLVGFSTQCSIDPVHFLVCLSKQNRTYEIARRAPALAVHVLHDTEADRRLASLFGERTAHDEPAETGVAAKLRRCEWRTGPWAVPVVDGLDWFAGEIVARHDVGDHVAFVLAVGPGGTPVPEGPVGASPHRLGFQAVRDLDPGNPA
ncbi:MAG: flavin reductase family protein [Acidimicrobiia bacterium]